MTDALLLRLPVDGHDWSEHLPPAPPGEDVTVAFSSAIAMARHGELLDSLGYRCVGVVVTGRPRGAPATCDVLVARTLAVEHAAWWRALADRAERAYDLAMGPVAVALADAVDVHRAAGAAAAGTGGPAPVRRPPARARTTGRRRGTTSA